MTVPAQIMDDSKAQSSSSDEFVTKLYKYRFFVLFLFCCFSALNAFQWIEISIIQDIVKKYYDVSDTAVNWTALIFCATYIPFIFPASWLTEKKGLRYVIIIGSFGTALGACIKVFAVHPDRFCLLMVGQTVVAISQVFVLSIPPRLAAVWFSPEEVSRACSIGVFGNQVGVALGFQIPTLLVPNSDEIKEVASGLWVLHIAVASCCSLLLLVIIFAFRDKPDLPPSRAQTNIKEPDFSKTLKNLFTNKSYVFLLISYGINVGTFYAISILLNQVVSRYFPGHNAIIGLMGFVLVISGMVGSLFCGVLLDKTKKFKEVTLGVYILSLVGVLAYTFVLNSGSIISVFFVTSCLGFFLTGYLPIGFEFSSEITYPEPESTSSGLLNAGAQICGIVFLSIANELDRIWGDVVSHLVLSGFMVVGVILTALCRSDLRRQRAFAGIMSAEPDV